MALSIISRHSPYYPTDTDDFLALEPYGDDYEKSLRPSLAEKLQVGFLSSDQFTQTNATEILEIKHVTGTVKSLVREMDTLKRDFEFNKQVLKATFEKRLQDKTYELYSKLNNRLRDLQGIHEERVAVVRRSFKQQLQDTLIKMATHYKQYYEAKLAGKLVPTQGSKAKEKILALENELNTSQALSQMLQMQIDQLRAELAVKDAIPEVKVDTTELENLQDQNRDLQMEIMKLNDKIDELTNLVRFREDKIADLSSELTELTSETEKEKEATKRLARQLDEFKKKMNSDKMDALKQLDQQKLAHERDLADKMAASEAQLSNSALERQRLYAEMEAKMQEKLLEEKKKYELKIVQLNEEVQLQARQMQNVSNLDRIIAQQKHEVLAMRQRLAKSEKQWEKKFSVLRASLHALKDESYVRMQLQKQSASLKYASVNYGPEESSQNLIQQGNEMAQSVPAPGRPMLPAMKPLPSITRGGHVMQAKRTNTIPSGVGTEPFSDVDEEEEHEPEGFVPLPQKPPMLGDYMPVATSET